MKTLYILILATSLYNNYLPFFFGTLKFLKLKHFNIIPIVISDRKYLDHKYYPIAHFPYPFNTYLKSFIIKNALKYYNCDKNDYTMYIDADTMIRKKNNYDNFEQYLLNDKMLFSISPWTFNCYDYENNLIKENYILRQKKY